MLKSAAVKFWTTLKRLWIRARAEAGLLSREEQQLLVDAIADELKKLPAPKVLTGRRAPKPERMFWSADWIRGASGDQLPVFKMGDGTRYLVHKSGAFINLDKNRRPVKERKRARRLEREARAAAA